MRSWVVDFTHSCLMWARRVSVVSVSYPIYSFFSLLFYPPSTFSMMKSLSCASVLSWTTFSKFFTFQMTVNFWRWKFDVCPSMDGSMPAGVAVFPGVAVAKPEMVRNLASLMMRGRCPCSPPPLRGLHRGCFDGKLVDKEGV